MSLDQLAPADPQLNLLDLPREIRDTIYLAVLQTPSLPPASPEDAGPRSAGHLYEGSKLITSVHYLSDLSSRYASQSLLACNHQIRAERHEVLARHDKPGARGLDFKLDVMIQYGVVLPTWALVPGPVSHVRNLEVDVRMLCSHYKDGLRYHNGRREIFRPLLNLLCRGFQYGPKLYGECLTDNGLRLDRVTLTICWWEMLESLKSLRHGDAVVDESPSNGLLMKHRLVELVLRKARSTASQGESWRVSQIRLNSDKEVEELSARDRELARKIVNFWDGYEEHWRWKKNLSRKFESNNTNFHDTAL